MLDMRENVNTLKKYFNMTQNDIGKHSYYKVGPMKFSIENYTIEGIGNLTLMRGKAMAGLMKMDTFLLTPQQVDAPLFSYDRIIALGNDTIIVEIYDTLLNQDEVSDRYHERMLEVKNKYGNEYNHDLGEHWYDSIKLDTSFSKKGKVKKQGKLFDTMYLEMFDIYVDFLQETTKCDVEKKKEVSTKYVDGLFSNGGPSTDQFIKAIGKEAAYDLFTSIIFGTK